MRVNKIAEFYKGVNPTEEKKMEKAANDNFPVLISLNDAAKITSMSRSMLNRYRSEGRFPVAVELGDRRVAFVRAEVLEWVRGKIANRQQVAA
ncbi:helix-turn-helix transcriptional regulator [Rhizobium sp. G187]|uniref:helix-turn-helix transcriptional regulator n=1 Tax=Rhizobium sp. G187 TaxID=3451352 RepID=UPI003EE73170